MTRDHKMNATLTRIPLSCQPRSDWTEIAVEWPYGIPMATYRAFPNGGTARWAICDFPVESVGGAENIAGLDVEQNPTGVWEWVVELREAVA